MSNTQDNIQVAIRIRPLIKREQEKKLKVQWNVQKNNIYPIDETGQRNGELYSFDHIFNTDDTNVEIYENVVRPFVDSSLKGLNSTIFAYGQTSSGKTFTMFGDKETIGIMPLAVENIFDSIDQNINRKFLLRVSYIEIYNEKINDLLDTENKDIKIREFSSGLIGLQNVKEEIVSTREQVYECLKRGNENRHIGETNMNIKSSRSHTIFKIVIESVEISNFDVQDCPLQISNINFVDLAGSERVAQTKATGVRLKEGSHINKSLSTLALVIRQLSEGQEFVNFRDSKLTRLLQHSLGGNSKTLIIATITLASLENTNSTLSFAQRAKAVKNKPEINEVLTESAASKRYAQLNAQLRERLEEQLVINRNLELTQEKNYKEISRLQEQMSLLESFQHGNPLEKFVNIPKRRHTIGHLNPNQILKAIAEEPEEVNETNNGNRGSFEMRKYPATPSTVVKSLHKEFPASERPFKIRYLSTSPKSDDICPFVTSLSEETENIDEQKYEEEAIAHLEKKYKIREEELLKEIGYLEEQLEMRASPLECQNSNYVCEDMNLDDEIKELKVELMDLLSLLNVLPEKEPEKVSEVDSKQHIVEKFVSKLKMSKEIIEKEIFKQINSFTQIDDKSKNTPVVLPNELDSFNNLLKQLTALQNDITDEMLVRSNGENIDTLKMLVAIYESFLKKNEFIGRCSEKIVSLQEQIKLHDEEINNLKINLNDIDLVIKEKDNVIAKMENDVNLYKKKIEQYQNQFFKLAEENDAKSQRELELENLNRTYLEKIKCLEDTVDILANEPPHHACNCDANEVLKSEIINLEEGKRKNEEVIIGLRTVIDGYKNTLEESEKSLDNLKEIIQQNTQTILALNSQEDSNKQEIESLNAIIKEYLKKNEALNLKTETLNINLRNEIDKNRSLVKKFENVLLNIIDQLVKDEKTLLTTRHPQEERDYLKNVRKDLKEVNIHLKQQLQLLQSGKNYDLDTIREMLIKSNEVIKNYFNAEKSILESHCTELEDANNAYVGEISILKQMQGDMINKENKRYEVLKTEITDLNNALSVKEIVLTKTQNQVRSLEEKLKEVNDNNNTCLRCNERGEKMKDLEKNNFKLASEVMDLRQQLYEMQDKKVEIEASDLMQLYKERNHAQRIELEKYKKAAAAANVPRVTTEVQCDLLTEEPFKELQKKYNALKHLCHNINKELESCKEMIAASKVSCSSVETQCDLLDAASYTALQKKYNTVKFICQSRKDEIETLRKQLK